MSTPAAPSGQARATGPIPWRDVPWRTRVSLVLALTTMVVLSAGLIGGLGVAAFVLHPTIGIAYAASCAGVAVLAHVRRRRVRRRRKVFAEWADARGWESSPHASVLVGRWTARPFAGASRSASDVLRGVVDGVRVTSFTHGGSLDPRVRVAGRSGLHVVMATLPASFPALTVAPEDPVTRAAGALGVQDIVLESAEFNRRWRVACADARFAHAVLHPRLMERLMAPDAEGMSLLLEERDVVVHAPGPTVLEDVEPRAALLVDVVRLLPPYLLADRPAPVRLRRRRAREVRA